MRYPPTVPVAWLLTCPIVSAVIALAALIALGTCHFLKKSEQ